MRESEREIEKSREDSSLVFSWKIGAIFRERTGIKNIKNRGENWGASSFVLREIHCKECVTNTDLRFVQKIKSANLTLN